MTTLNPASLGTSLGQRLALMRERVLPPGAIPRTKLVWGRCHNSPRCGDGTCLEAGKCLAGGTIVLPCSACWDTEKVSTNLTILGPLDAPAGIECERCEGRDGKVQSERSPETQRQMEHIAAWNAMIDSRIEGEIGMNATCSCGHDAENHGWFGCAKCNCSIARKSVR